jgi:L-ribulose-5-phosphate 4-epimerase
VARYRDLLERALEANLEILRAGLVVLTFGNASAVDRRAGLMAIKPSGVPYDDLTSESMVLVDLERGTTVDTELKPSSDAPTHLVLYRRFASIGGIVHTHSPKATAWAQSGRPIPCLGTTHADHFNGPVPVSRELTAGEIGGEYEERTGDVIAETIEALELEPLEQPAVLVRSHGPFTWGRDAAHAVENAIALEAVAAMALDSLALSPAVTEISGELLRRHFRRKHGPDAYYGQR